MTKHIEPKTANQGTALATATLVPPLVIEGFEEFKGSFERLCLQAGTAAIETMLAADAEQLCGRRYQRHADRQGHRWGMLFRVRGPPPCPCGGWGQPRAISLAARCKIKARATRRLCGRSQTRPRSPTARQCRET